MWPPRTSAISLFAYLYAGIALYFTVSWLVQAYRKGKLRSARFSLLECLAIAFGFGLVMACISTIAARLSFGDSLLIPAAIGTATSLPMGYLSGHALREKIRGHHLFVRGLAFTIEVLAAPSLIPAVATTILVCWPTSPFRNGWPPMIAWLVLIAPVLGSFWVAAIDKFRKEEQPIHPQD